MMYKTSCGASLRVLVLVWGILGRVDWWGIVQYSLDEEARLGMGDAKADSNLCLLSWLPTQSAINAPQDFSQAGVSHSALPVGS